MQFYEYLVQGTSDGSKRRGDFVCFINAGKMVIKKTGFLLFKNHRNGKDIQIAAKYFHSGKLDDNTILMDQKLRCALAVEKGDTILFRHYKRKRDYVKWGLERVFGVQKNIVRVSKSSYNDMEINVCRLKHETMQTIHIKDGDVVVIESDSVTKGTVRKRMRALELSPVLEREIAERAQKYQEAKKAHGFDPEKHVKYANCKDLLKIDELENNPSDLQPIYIDFDARNDLGIQECDPVRIYRDVTSEIIKRLHLISIPLILSICTALITYDPDKPINYYVLGAGILIILVLNFFPVKLKK